MTSIELTGEATLPLPHGAKLEFALEMQGTEFVRVTDMAAFEALTLPLYTNRPLGAQNTGELTLVEDPILVEDPPEGLKKRQKKRPNVLANVEIVLPNGTPRDAAFDVTFRAKQAHWAYYCVTSVITGNNAPDGEGLNIKDVSLGSDAIVFGAANRKVFDATTAASELEKDPLAALLVRQNQDLRCWRFLSDEPVGLRAEPRSGLELRLGDHPISSKLPNPPARNTTVISENPNMELPRTAFTPASP